MSHGEAVPYSLYVYAPNKIAPAVFAGLYAASTVGHVYQCYRYKAWKLVGLHAACAFLFTAGYAFREFGAFHYSYFEDLDLIMFILSQVFIYICPPILELINYNILGHIFYYAPYIAPFPPGKVLAVFGLLMLFVETLNGLGVSFASNPKSQPTIQKMGGHLTIAALSIQFVLIVTFVALSAVFHWRFVKLKLQSKVISTLLPVLYASMLLIFIRCIYRLIEHTGHTAVDLSDFDSLQDLTPILRYEVFFYIFEATFMLINSVIWNIWNPARFLPADYHTYLAQDGSGETHAEVNDERTRAQKIGAKLTIGLFFRNKEDQGYWELKENLTHTHAVQP
ncbi:unnamed protein product [Clonostachys rhizophaga]|uniref:Uncharacterized protein n=1 Tax=Clonostachys rhizophaga TaxID=160324 RepID=A0A9N9VZZ3_9HYPO|nr:unnamed protein product [Clonostachys rhizophaga]